VIDFRNPYTPGAGVMPKYLAGRDDIIDNAKKRVEAVVAGYQSRSIVYYGLRGVGKTVLLNAIENIADENNLLMNIPFNPIVEIVSSYKLIRKQSSLFELLIGKGGLLVCTLNLNQSDPGACYLKSHLLNYLASSSFSPDAAIESDRIVNLLHSSQELNADFSTDEGYDVKGHVQTKDR
jgi:hypothetical protein